MRSSLTSAALIIACVCVPVIAATQEEPAEAPSWESHIRESLDALLASAKSNNPDIQAAQAALNRAVAGLARTRAQVMRDVATLFERRANAQSNVRKYTSNNPDFKRSELELRIAELNSELKYALGFGASVLDESREQSVPETLDEVLRLAESRNPDIQAAEADAAMARAELKRTAMRVQKEVVTLHRKREDLQRLVDMASKKYEIGTEDAQAVAHLRMRLAEVEGELRYAAGLDDDIVQGIPVAAAPQMGLRNDASFQSSPPMKEAPRADYESIPEDIRPILDSTAGIVFEDVNLVEILEFLSETYEFNISADPSVQKTIVDYVNMRNAPILNILESLADMIEPLCFVIRDYGVFATTTERARYVPGPSIPPGIPFYVHATGEESAAAPRPEAPAPSAFQSLPPMESVPRPGWETVSDKTRQMLDMRLGAAFEDIKLHEIMEFLVKTYELNISTDPGVNDMVVDFIQVKNTSLKSFFQALADQVDSLCFVFRDYGIFVTTKERAQRIAAPTIPPDIPLYVPKGSSTSIDVRR